MRVHNNIQDIARSGNSRVNGTRMEHSVPNRPTMGLGPEHCPLPPSVKHHVTKIKTDHRREDVEEVLQQIRVLVKDIANKLQATNDRLHKERPDNTAESPDNLTAEMASYVMNKFEYPTSLCFMRLTLIIISF